MFRPEHFPAAVESVRAHPSLRFVLDHLGKAPIASGSWSPGRPACARWPRSRTSACKLSGVHTIAAPGRDVRRPRTVRRGGAGGLHAGRVLFGSDWPVSLQRASYADVVATATRACAALSPAERSAVLGGNARERVRARLAPVDQVVHAGRVALLAVLLVAHHVLAHEPLGPLRVALLDRLARSPRGRAGRRRAGPADRAPASRGPTRSRRSRPRPGRGPGCRRRARRRCGTHRSRRSTGCRRSRRRGRRSWRPA